MSSKNVVKLQKTTGKKQPAREIAFRYTSTHLYTGLIIACFAFVIYSNSFRNGYVLDDYSAITINRFVHEGFAGIPKLMTVDFWYFSNMKLGYYRPLSLVTFAIEYQFFGASPHVSHFFNVAFFTLAVFLLFLVLTRVFSTMNLIFPLLITLLFAAHPIHTEVIDNLKGRDELLSFFNIMLMLFFTLKYADHKKTKDQIFSLLFFYLALLSKESALTGIVLLPLVLFYSGKRKLSDISMKVFPFLLVVFLFFIQRRLALGSVPAIIPDDIINYPYRDEAVKFSTAFLLFLFTLKMLIWPYPLRYDYSFNQIPAIGWDNIWAISGVIFFFAILIYTVSQVRKRTAMGIGLGFFLITMVPMMAFILLRGGIFAERNLFAPSLGICMIVIILLEKIFANAFKPDRLLSFRWVIANPLIVLIVLLICIPFSAITLKRNTAWVDSLTLFTTDVKTGENSAQNQLHYGSDLIIKAAGEKDVKVKDALITSGMSAIKKALIIHPSFGDAMFRYAYGYEVKLTYKPESRYVDSTIYFFNKAIEFAPTLADAYRHLGIIYEWQQRFDVASYYYNRAFQINPQLMSAKQKADELKTTRGLDVKVNPLSRQFNPNEKLRY
ncbi:MAG: tetratricopeptide repeat protein [Bacteroidales bacterium]|nr:tetratricopeptide repeat protein [Bacteroidales bacterium]